MGVLRIDDRAERGVASERPLSLHGRCGGGRRVCSQPIALFGAVNRDEDPLLALSGARSARGAEASRQKAARKHCGRRGFDSEEETPAHCLLLDYAQCRGRGALTAPGLSTAMTRTKRTFRLDCWLLRRQDRS
jgi:hypothetical protein